MPLKPQVRPRQLLLDLFEAGVRAATPEIVLPGRLPQPAAGRTLIVAVGKAAAAMAAVAHPRMGPRAETIVLTRYGHGLPESALLPGMVQYLAGHPVPDAAGEAAARAILSAARALGPQDMLLALISGGGSALLALPPPGVSLQDLSVLNRMLLASGMAIADMNCVRKHVSAISGGRLAAAAAPAQVVTLAISDIPGDDPALIASGPTLPDATTLEQARAALAACAITPPTAIAAALLDPGNETPVLNAGACTVIASARSALEAAAEVAEGFGYRPIILGDAVEGEARLVARDHARRARSVKAQGGRWALLSGGETTVTVANPAGRGGRNGAFLLALALELGGEPGVYALSADTDGIDGTQDNAGGLLAPDTLERLAARGIDPAAALAADNAYDVFSALDDLVITGPTQTNVNDFRALLIQG